MCTNLYLLCSGVVNYFLSSKYCILLIGVCMLLFVVLQGESLARGPELLSIKNYVIEIMTSNFIYTYRERCKTGPAHNRC